MFSVVYSYSFVILRYSQTKQIIFFYCFYNPSTVGVPETFWPTSMGSVISGSFANDVSIKKTKPNQTKTEPKMKIEFYLL